MSNPKLERLKASWKGHTPGPLEVRYERVNDIVRIASGIFFITDGVWCTRETEDRGIEERLANAYLFACAPAIPDLVAALENACRVMEMAALQVDGDLRRLYLDPAYKQANAALDKLVEGM